MKKMNQIIKRRLYAKKGQGMRLQIPLILATLAGLNGNEDVQLTLKNGEIVISSVPETVGAESRTEDFENELTTWSGGQTCLL
ncbi:hypothetical protein HNV12_20865 [Methanococcoides sp. SA1]|nr:hypothetical protein [Methanococcoides sp. SA1]